MTSSTKTKRVAAVTALSASLLMGGVAAAAADGPTCRHGKGKGLGIGAPGKGKGKGAERGWRHGCQDKDHPADESTADAGPAAAAAETSDPAVAGASAGSSAGTPGSGVNAEVSVEVALPDAGALAGQTAQDATGLLRPLAETVLGQVHQTVGQAQEAAHETVDLARSDVAGIVELLQETKAEAAGLPVPSFDAGVMVDGTAAAGTLNVNGTTLSGVTTLADHVVSGAFGLAGGTAGGLRGIVAGFVLPL